MPSDLNIIAIENLTTQIANVVSTNNSFFTSSLDANGIFQGTGEDVSQYGRVGIAIHSDNATDGTLTMEVSHDGVTYFGPSRDWANTNIAVPHTWNIVEKYFRIKYVNGTTAATNLSIQTQYSNKADIVLGHQINEILPAENESQTVRPTNSFDLDTARIHIKGQSADFFFGKNDALQNGVFEDVWNGGGDIQWQTVAAKVKVQSTNAADTSDGTGLRSVEIHGLSSTGVDQKEVINMNGVTAVESSLSYIRLSLCHNEEVGTYGGSHEGDIEVRVTNATFSNGALLASMTGQEGSVNVSSQYGIGEAQNGFTSVPLGKVLYITRIEVIPNTSKAITVILYERDGLLIIAAPFQPRRIIWQAEEIVDAVEKEFKSHIKIKSLTDLFFRAEGTAGAAGVAVWLDFYLVDADADGA